MSLKDACGMKIIAATSINVCCKDIQN